MKASVEAPVGASDFTRADTSMMSWRRASRVRKKLRETNRFAEASAVPFGEGVEALSKRWSAVRPRLPPESTQTPTWVRMLPAASRSVGLERFGWNAQVCAVPQNAAGQHIWSAAAWALAPLPLQ